MFYPTLLSFYVAIVEAFRTEGLRVGFYYSLIDWHHPDFTIGHSHPYAARPKPSN